MLSHSGIDAGHQPRYSTSRSSIRKQQQHSLNDGRMESETSRLHALIAAHRAMDRSRGPYSDNSRRTDCPAGRRTTQADTGVLHQQHPAASELHRQRSLLQTKAAGLAGGLPLLSNDGSNDEYVRAQAVIGTSTFEESYGSEPSYYRRIHRTRSMYTPQQTTTRQQDTTSSRPSSQPHSLRHVISAIHGDNLGLGVKLKRSFNFLRPATRIITAPALPQLELSCRPEAVRLARDQYLHEHGSVSAGGKSSCLLVPRARREPRAFRRSLRQEQSDGTSSVVSTSPSRTSGRELCKRSISASLRSCFKRILGKRENGIQSLPPQQLEATRHHHFFDIPDDPSGSTGFDSYHQNTSEAARRSSLYYSLPENAELGEIDDTFDDNPVTSIGRGHLWSGSQSRVTSWTDSTINGSLCELEANQKRLSVIKEDGGPHQPSSSAGRHVGGVPVHTQPQPTLIGPSPESRRLYSALVKRINEEQAGVRHTAAPSGGVNHESDDAEDGAATRPTIRTVEQDGSDRNVDTNHCRDESGNDSTLPRGAGYSTGAQRCRVSADELNDVAKHDNDRSQYHGALPAPEIVPRHSSGDLSSDRGRRTDKKFSETSTEVEPVLVHVPSLHSTPVYRQEKGSEKGHPIVVYEGKNTSDRKTALVKGAGGIGHTSQVNNTRSLRVPHTQLCDSSSALSMNDRIYLQPQDSKLKSTLGRDARSKKDENHNQIPRQEVSQQIQEGTDAESQHPHKRSGLANFVRGGCDPRKSDVAQAIGDTSCQRVPVMSSPTEYLLGSNQFIQSEQSSSGAGNVQSDGNRVAGTTRSFRKTSSEFEKFPKPEKESGVPIKIVPARKENYHMTLRSESPVSTPGEWRLQMRSGNSNGRLRKRQSTKECESDKIEGPGLGREQQSPADKLRTKLSARPSRPFNMDTPETKQPFDSICVGEYATGFGDSLRARPSVAPGTFVGRGPDSYGGLGASPFSPVRTTANGEDEDTALPQIPTPEKDEEKTGPLSLALSSRRMVSNFLRSRRKTEPKSVENCMSGSSTTSGRMGSEIDRGDGASAAGKRNFAASSPLFL